MARNPEYQKFLDVVVNHQDFEFDPNEETTASDSEIGWWKQHQIRRAIHHSRYDVATSTEIHLLESHSVPVAKAAKARTKSREL